MCDAIFSRRIIGGIVEWILVLGFGFGVLWTAYNRGFINHTVKNGTMTFYPWSAWVIGIYLHLTSYMVFYMRTSSDSISEFRGGHIAIMIWYWVAVCFCLFSNEFFLVYVLGPSLLAIGNTFVLLVFFTFTICSNCAKTEKPMGDRLYEALENLFRDKQQPKESVINL